MIARLRVTLVRTAGFLAWLLHPRLPMRLDAPRVQRRIARALADPERLADGRRHMEHLTGRGQTYGTLDEQAAAYIRFSTWNEALRWHPRILTRQRVEGLEHLRDAQAEGRGVLLSFVHHSHFAGIFGSLAKAGVAVEVLTGASTRRGGPQIRQHLRVVGRGGSIVTADRGIPGIVSLLGEGRTVGVAIDVPGSSSVRFANRDVRCSSGLVRAAQQAGAPIVPIATVWEDEQKFLQLGPAWRPSPEDDVLEVLQEIATWHEHHVLARPDASYLPLVCWRPLEDTD